MFNHQRYLMLSVVAIAVILIIIALFNYVVDPYNMLGNNKTGIYYWNERQVKNAVLTYPHDGLLIGSSKTGYVNPDELACYRFYNASLRGIVPEEIYFYLRKYLRNEKLVLIGFDFYMFNEREYPPIRIKDWDDIHYSLSEYLFGIHTVDASLETLKRWKKKEPSHILRPNGQFTYPGSTSARSDNDPPHLQEKYSNVIKGVTENNFGDFSFSTRRMENVRQIKQLLEERGTPYAIFINPLNADVLSALEKIEAHSLFVSWRQEMKAIFPDIYDFSISRYSRQDGYYSEDPYHYTNATGTAFLNEIVRDFCPDRSAP